MSTKDENTEMFINWLPVLLLRLHAVTHSSNLYRFKTYSGFRVISTVQVTINMLQLVLSQKQIVIDFSKSLRLKLKSPH